MEEEDHGVKNYVERLNHGRKKYSRRQTTEWHEVPGDLGEGGRQRMDTNQGRRKEKGDSLGWRCTDQSPPRRPKGLAAGEKSWRYHTFARLVASRWKRRDKLEEN